MMRPDPFMGQVANDLQLVVTGEYADEVCFLFALFILL